jgi:hypothetical protein
MIKDNWAAMDLSDKVFFWVMVLVIGCSVSGLVFLVTKDIRSFFLVLVIDLIFMVPFGIMTFPTKSNDYGRGYY